MASKGSLDGQFWPTSAQRRIHDFRFDFTLLFEGSILSILPSSIFLLAAVLRLCHLVPSRKKASFGTIGTLKLFVCIAYCALQLALLILAARDAHSNSHTGLASAALLFIVSLTILALSTAEHRFAVRPSSLLQVYLLPTVLCDVARTRTSWLAAAPTDVAVLMTMAVSVKTFILIVEICEKRALLVPDYQELPIEDYIGVSNRSIFWWLNSILVMGRKEILKPDDLYPLDHEMVGTFDFEQFLVEWDSGFLRSGRRNRLLLILMNRFKWQMLWCILPRVFMIAFSYSQPFLLNRVVAILSSAPTRPVMNEGYGMIGAYFLVYSGIAVCTGIYWYRTYRLMTMFRGALISTIFSRTLTAKTDKVEKAAATSLMGTDVERIAQSLRNINEIWANIVELGIAVWLLERQIGIGSIMPFCIAAVCMLGTFLISSRIGEGQKAWMSAVQKRLTVTVEALRSTRAIKLLGISDQVSTTIRRLRDDEIRISLAFRWLLVWTVALSEASSALAPGLTFLVYILATRSSNGTLVTNQAFVSLSILSLLGIPLASLIQSIPTVMSAVACFQRIQDYIDLPRFTDPRTIINKGTEEEKVRLSKNEDGSHVEVQHLAADCAIHVHRATISWPGLDEPVLSDIDFEIPKIGLTIIVGQIGVGKTSLLQALLGGMEITKGSITLRQDQIAFCGQSPWFMSDTIRNNIIGPLPFQQAWYDEVIHACALKTDFSHLSARDLTQVGNEGSTLSGGQKQRITIARAVYSRAPIILLDNSLSGLDKRTESWVFDNLFGPQGLLKRHGRSIIFITHNKKHLQWADQILYVDGQKRTCYRIEYNSFVESEIGHILDDSQADDKAEPQIEDPIESQCEAEAGAPDSNGSKQSLDDDRAAKLRQNGDVEVYGYYMKSIGALLFSTFASLMTAFSFCLVFPTLWLKWWSDVNTKQPNHDLGLYLGVYVFFGAFAVICVATACWLAFIHMVPSSGSKLHRRILDTTMQAPLWFLIKAGVGSITNRFSQDIQLVDMQLPLAGINLMEYLTTSVLRLVLICVSASYVSITAPFVVIAIYFLQKFYLRTSRQLRLLDLEAKAPLYSHFLETVSGLVEVRALGWEDASVYKNRSLLDASQRPFYLLLCIQRWLTFVLDCMIAGIGTLTVGISVARVGGTNAGNLGVALVNLINFSQSLAATVTFWASLETSIGAVSRIKEFATQSPSENQPCQTQTLPQYGWPSEGEVEFRDVVAAYSPAGDAVLKGVSFALKPRQKVGICGRTGSGKTSLLLALCQMLQVQQGEILVDSVKLNLVQPEKLRQRLTVIPQEAFFLDGISYRENVDPYRESSDEAMEEAFTAVGLWDKIHKLGGLDASFENKLLSQGQKQLFCMARALLRKSNLILLDEACSHVDDETAAIMQHCIQKKFPIATIIAVEHNVRNFQYFDQVIVMDGGRVAESGPPEELLRMDSQFKQLWTNPLS